MHGTRRWLPWRLRRCSSFGRIVLPSDGKRQHGQFPIPFVEQFTEHGLQRWCSHPHQFVGLFSRQRAIQIQFRDRRCRRPSELLRPILQRHSWFDHPLCSRKRRPKFRHCLAPSDGQERDFGGQPPEPVQRSTGLHDERLISRPNRGRSNQAGFGCARWLCSFVPCSRGNGHRERHVEQQLLPRIHGYIDGDTQRRRCGGDGS